MTLLASLLYAAGCGGKVEETGGEGGARTAANGEGGMSASKPPVFDSTIQLGACMPGFDPKLEVTRDCNWYAKGLCYETKLAACACICPRDREDSICSSGFEPGPSGKFEVICY